MGLKFLSLLFLLVAAAYAAPTLEDELEDPYAMEEVDDVMDEENDEEEDPTESLLDDEEEDPKKKKKKPKMVQLFGAHVYCVCKRGKKKGDVMEDSKSDEVSDHIDEITEDVEFSDPRRSRKAKFAAYLKKLVGPYFGVVRPYCYCTKNKAVVRLLRYLKVASIIGRRQKVAFWRRVKALIASVKKQKRG